MAVTVAVLTRSLRAGDSPDEVAEITRILGAAKAMVRKYAGAGASVPTAICDEAVIRLASYLYDQPTASRGMAFSNAGRNSGAWSIVAPYRVQRAGAIEDTV